MNSHRDGQFPFKKVLSNRALLLEIFDVVPGFF